MTGTVNIAEINESTKWELVHFCNIQVKVMGSLLVCIINR